MPDKVFPRKLINRVHYHLQRPKQSGFTPKRSTIDCMLALCDLTECRREFRQELHAPYVDLRKTFDSVNEDAFWRILGPCEVPANLINLISELYSGTESVVRCGVSISDLFPVVTGVCRRFTLAPTLFSACMVWILGRMSER